MKPSSSCKLSLVRSLVLILLLHISIVLSGTISGWDVVVNYSNSNLLSKYSFVFSVETPLESSDYILIEMPYLLHSSLSGSNVPIGVTALLGKANYTNACSLDCSSSSDLTRVQPLDYIIESQLFSSTITVNAATQTMYFVSLSKLSSLEAATDYVIIIYSQMVLSSTLSGQQFFVKLSSVSSSTTASDSTLVIYDQNPLFSALTVSAPITTTSLSAVDYEVSAPSQTDFLAVYEVLVDFMHSQTSQTQGSLYEIDFGLQLNSMFSFVTTNTGTLPHLCLSVSRNTNAFTINALKTSQYSCRVSEKRVSIEIPEILNSQRLRFSIYILNPNEVPPALEYLVISKLKLYSRQAYQQGSTPAFLSVRGIILKTSNLKLGWGIDKTTQVAPLTQLSLFANSATGAPTYNSIQFQFTTLQSSPDSKLITLRFCVATTVPSIGKVLPGSIIHNFDEASDYGLRIECSEKLISGFPYIECINVGAITADKIYYIGFKITIQNGCTPDTVRFSQVSATMVSAVYPSATPSILMVAQSIFDPTTITTLTNLDYFMSGSGNTAISSQTIATNSPQSIYSPHGDADNGILGLVPEGTADTAQKLIFTISLANTEYVTLGASLNNVGFYMLTNKNAIQFSSSATLTMDTYGSAVSVVSSSTTQLSFDEFSSSGLGSYTRFKYTTTTSSNLAALFSSNNIFAIRTVFVRQHTSLYADDNNLDFYFLFYDNMALPAPVFSFAFLYNAYTINSPKPFNLRYSVANWYGGANVNNDGSNVPTLLRIAGYFNEYELLSGTKRLALFFTGLELFEETDSFGVSCASSIGTTATHCRGFINSNTVYQNFQQMSRVEVEFPTDLPSGSVDAFELIIPVKTIVKKTSITLFVAAMKYHDIIPKTLLEQQAMKDYFFQPTSVFRLTGSNNLQNTDYFISFSSFEANNVKLFSGYRKSGIDLINNYGMELSKNTVGEIVSSVAINAHHTEDGTIVGTNTQDSSNQNNGAGFTFASEFDFRTQQQNYGWEAGIPSNIRRCLSFQYFVSSAWRYGFFCAIETGSAKTVSKVLVSNFQLPSKYGLQLPSSTSFAFSTNTGLLATLKYESQYIGKANRITTTSTAASPILFKGAKNLRMVWTLTTSNVLPDNGIVSLEFENRIGLSNIGSTCSFNLAIPHTCTVTVPSYQDNVIRFSIAFATAGLSVPSGVVQIFHYGNDAHQIPTSSNRFQVKTFNSALHLIDETDPVLMYPSILDHRSTSEPLKFLLVGTSGVVFSHPYTQAEGQLEVLFNTANGRELQIGETIFLNLKAFASVNFANKIYKQIACYIYRNSTIISHSFSETEVVSTATNLQIVFTVSKDIVYSKQSPFSLKCRNVRMPSTATISPLPSIELRKADRVTLILNPIEIACATLKTTASLLGTPTLALKRFPTHGSISTISFSFTTTTTVGTNYFLIRFPKPYLSSLAQDASLRCLINSSQSNCVVKTPLLLQVQGVPESVASFTLVIEGIQMPLFTVTVGEEPFFYLAHMNQAEEASNKLSTLVRYAFINDVAPTALTTNTIEISNVTLSNTHVQRSNQLSFTFNLPTALASVSSLYTLVLSFPKEWRYLLPLLNPAITLKRNSTNTYITLSSTTITSVVEATFSWTASATTVEPLILKLFNIPNPEVVLPVLGRQWNLHVSQAGNPNGLYARTIPMMNSIPYYQFNYLAEKLVLVWKYQNSESSYRINKGPFKTLVTLTVKNNKRFTHPLRIALKDDNLFALTPPRPFARPGDTQVSFYVHSLSETPTSSFIVFFTKLNDSFNMYTNMPVCYFDVAKTTQSIRFADSSISSISVPKNGMSNPLVIEYTPLGFNVTTDAVVTAEILNVGSFGLSIVGESSKTLSGSSQSPRIAFQFQASSSSIVGVQLFVKFSLKVKDSNEIDWTSMFTLPDTIPIDITLLRYSGASYQITASGLDSISTNSVVFRPFCPQAGVIYYRLQINNVYNLTESSSESTYSSEQLTALKQLIQAGAKSFIGYSASDLTQTQYGIAVSDGQSEYTEIKIGNLFSGKPYKIQSFCVNPFSQESSNILTSEFTTNSNGGSIQKIYLSFASALTMPEQIMATCYLGIYFGISPSNVYTMNRVTCKDYTSQYDFDNSEANLAYTPSTKRNQYTFYFIPDLTLASDYITETIQAAIASETFVFLLKKFFSKYSSYQFLEWSLELPSTVVQTFPDINSVGFLEAASTSSSNFPRINEEYYVDISQSESAITIDFIRLTKDGFVFVGLENTLQNHKYEDNYAAFSSNNFLQGKNYQGKIVTYGVQISAATASTSTKLVFSNLPYTNNFDRFEVYMAVTEEDPSIFAMKSTIRKTTLVNYSVTVTFTDRIIFTLASFILLLILF